MPALLYGAYTIPVSRLLSFLARKTNLNGRIKIGPYIIGIQSDKLEFLFLMLSEYGTGHPYSSVYLFLFFFTFSFFDNFQNKAYFIRRKLDSLFVGACDQGQHDRGKIASGLS